MKRIRGTVLWLAAIFVVATSTLGYAQVGENHGSDVSVVAKPTEPPKGPDHGEAVSEAAKNKEAAADETPAGSGERKLNHGFYVSQAAHCEDVDDPDTEASPDFTAPEDCADAGHGGYVSSVAKSSLGKKPKKNTAD